MTGPLLGFDGQSYRVDTRFGVLTLDRDGVDCTGACPGPDFIPEIRFSGAVSLADVLVPALVDAFAGTLGLRAVVEPADDGELRFLLSEPEGRAYARFVIRRGSTADGVADLIAGRSDLVLADRPLTADEVAQVREAGLGDLSDRHRRRLIGKRDLRLVVPDRGDATPLHVGQVVDVLSGDVTGWSDLGRDGGAITVHALGEEIDQVRARLTSLARFVGRTATLGPVVAHESPEAIVQALANTPGALALTAQTIFSGTVVPVVAACAEGQDQAFLPSGLDPLTARFWIMSGAPRLPDIARAFLVYATGPGAQRVVDRAGFIDKRPDPVTLSQQGARIAQAVLAADEDGDVARVQRRLRALVGAERLTVTFRFVPATARLDAESISELQVLAAILDSGLYDGRELIFAGFTDSDGSAADNQRLSDTRAVRVREAVEAAMATQASRVDMVSFGFGEAMPLACEGDGYGRHVNRRVEVWLR
ncbi:MAG: phosphate ABC transporter substrate-binding/OmpA family protein [Pseudomonadota bacterium]